MKSFFKALISFFESMGKARAAAELARSGHLAESRKLMSK